MQAIRKAAGSEYTGRKSSKGNERFSCKSTTKGTEDNWGTANRELLEVNGLQK